MMVRPSLLTTMRRLLLLLFLLAIASTNAIPTGEQKYHELVTRRPSRHPYVANPTMLHKISYNRPQPHRQLLWKHSGSRELETTSLRPL